MPSQLVKRDYALVLASPAAEDVMDALHVSHEDDFQFRVPPDPRVPYRKHVEMAQLWREDLRRQKQMYLSSQNENREALHHAQRKLRNLLNEETRHELDLLRREIHERYAYTPQATMGGGIPQSEIDRIKDALHGHGIDTDAIRTTVGNIRDYLQKPDRRYPLVTVLDLAKWGDYYHRPDPAPRNPWVTFRPPYWGWQTGHNTGAVADFNIGHQHLIDPNTGHVGSIITLDCDSASDISVGSRTTHTQIAFWYQAPVTGLVEINVTAICGEARHQLKVFDEWGVSDAGVSQRCHIMAHALHPSVRGPSFQLASEFNFDGDTSAHRDEQHVLPGQTVFAPLLSDGPVAAGDWMIIRVGVANMSGSITNDMEIHSTCTMSWFLSRIDVHIRE
jgi:hypothetical protein